MKCGRCNKRNTLTGGRKNVPDGSARRFRDDNANTLDCSNNSGGYTKEHG